MRILNIIVSGTVQGVGYRYFTKRLADRLGVTGWVRNLPDGNVEVVAHFPDDETEHRFLAELQEGPMLGKVTGLDHQPVKSGEQFNTFEITF